MKQKLQQKYSSQFDEKEKTIKIYVNEQNLVKTIADLKYDDRFIYIQDIAYDPARDELIYFLV